MDTALVEGPARSAPGSARPRGTGVLPAAGSGGTLDKSEIASLATLPSLDELRGRLVGLLQAPAQKLATLLQAPAAQLARVVEASSKKLTEGGAA